MRPCEHLYYILGSATHIQRREAIIKNHILKIGDPHTLLVHVMHVIKKKQKKNRDLLISFIHA